MPRARTTRRKGRKNRSLRLRRQRGGQVSAKPFSDWIAAVQNTGLLNKPGTSFEEIKQKQEILAIPTAIPTEENTFVIPGLSMITDTYTPVDYRVLAAQLAGNDLLYRIMNRDAPVAIDTPTMFAQEVSKIDPESREQLIAYENALRPRADLETITDLADTTAYPLIIWFLALNYVGDTETAPPALRSKEKVEESASKFSSSEPLSTERPSEPTV